MNGYILAGFWIALMVGIGMLVMLYTGCAGDGKQEAWIKCAVTSHEVCRMMDRENEQRCEYEYYKRCING